MNHVAGEGQQGQAPEETVLYNTDVASLDKQSSQSEPPTTGIVYLWI